MVATLDSVSVGGRADHRGTCVVCTVMSLCSVRYSSHGASVWHIREFGKGLLNGVGLQRCVIDGTVTGKYYHHRAELCFSAFCDFGGGQT